MSAYTASYGLRCACLRLTNVYGAGHGRLKDSIVARLMRAIRTGSTFEIYGDGRQVRDYVHVGDVAAAARLALDAEDWHGPVVIGSGTLAVGARRHRRGARGHRCGASRCATGRHGRARCPPSWSTTASRSAAVGPALRACRRAWPASGRSGRARTAPCPRHRPGWAREGHDEHRAGTPVRARARARRPGSRGARRGVGLPAASTGRAKAPRWRSSCRPSTRSRRGRRGDRGPARGGRTSHRGDRRGRRSHGCDRGRGRRGRRARVRRAHQSRPGRGAAARLLARPRARARP